MLVGQIKADLDAVDEEGDSALHMVLHKQSSINSEINENEAPSIYGVSFYKSVVLALGELLFLRPGLKNSK